MKTGDVGAGTSASRAPADLPDTATEHCSSQAPKAPQLRLRVGLTGHRPGSQLPSDAANRVRPQVDEVLKHLVALLREIHQRSSRFYAPDAPLVSVIGSLAEGADRVGAVAALDLGLDLQTVLPFPRDKFEADFATPDSRREFRDLLARASAVFEIDDDIDDPARISGYVVAGEQILASSDLLLAIWDGEPAKGRGGTADVVFTAERAGMPCIWISPAVGAAPQVINAENSSRGSGSADRSWQSQLADIVVRITAPPTNGTAVDASHAGYGHSKLHSAGERVQRFFDDAARDSVLIPIYDGFRFIFGGHPIYRARSPATRDDDRLAEWTFFARTALSNTAFLDRIGSRLLDRYLWADRLATHYGRIYRGAYVTIFALAGLAVPTGLASVLVEADFFKALMVALEVALILIVIGLHRRGHAQGWHDRWLEYREIAETLRYGRWLAFTGRLPCRHAGVSDNGPQGRWTAWYIDAVFREFAIPSVCADRAYLDRVAEAAVKHEIEPQIRYHAANGVELSKTNHRLDKVGTFLFTTTALVGVMFLALLMVKMVVHAPPGLEHLFAMVIEPAELILMAGLPAIGAALSGIRAQGDFQMSADRSAAMVQDLEALKRQLLAARTQLTISSLSAVLLSLTQTMALELNTWRLIYRRRPLSLPA
jgi:hypothetical protein